MKRTPHNPAVEDSSENRKTIEPGSQITSSSRRTFLSKVGMAATTAGVLSSVPSAVAQAVNRGASNGPSVSNPNIVSNPRVQIAYNLRVGAATRDASANVPPHTTSGDEQLYPDHSASYSKGLLQDDIGVVNPAAWQSFKKALNSGLRSDWDNIIIGGVRTQNGPLQAYQYDLTGLDAVQLGNAPYPGIPGNPVVPPFDPVYSDAYGTQLIEMYWSSLLYDVAFTDYATNNTAIQAAAEISAQPTYRGPRDSNGQVTPDNLFRGAFPGETIGPYMSQFMITPTMYGAQSLSMQFQNFTEGIDFVTTTDDFLAVQNGNVPGTQSFDSTPRYLHSGRGLAAYTHVDVLYQAYFTAFLIMAANKFPVNPGNPYVGSKTMNGFGSFGGPDFAACMGECAAKALNRVWYQKWLVHLVHRPESGGGVCHQILSGNGNKIDAKLRPNILNSAAPQQVFSKYGTYLLPQTFPEGAPTHPCYPTGHGTVAGAAITFLKFFFDETHVFANPQVPSNDGLSLLPYTGGDAGQITVGGELHKLAHNVSFGHGIHAGIHWRYSTDSSIRLGEALAISMLQDKAKLYHEKFTCSFTNLDGNTVTISNQ